MLLILHEIFLTDVKVKKKSLVHNGFTILFAENQNIILPLFLEFNNKSY